MKAKFPATMDIDNAKIDKILAEVLSLCIYNGVVNKSLMHEAIKTVSSLFGDGLEYVYSTHYVVVLGVFRAYYKLMSASECCTSEVKSKNVGKVCLKLVEYLAKNDPDCQRESEEEWLEEIFCRITIALTSMTYRSQVHFVGREVAKLTMNTPT